MASFDPAPSVFIGVIRGYTISHVKAALRHDSETTRRAIAA
jgi:hypothetical protein